MTRSVKGTRKLQTLVASSGVSDEPPFETFARLGLQMVQADPT